MNEERLHNRIEIEKFGEGFVIKEAEFEDWATFGVGVYYMGEVY